MLTKARRIHYARKGGKARAANLTAERRIEIAKEGGKRRQALWRAAQKAKPR